jgi:hypothetical protein
MGPADTTPASHFHEGLYQANISLLIWNIQGQNAGDIRTLHSMRKCT